MRDRISLAGSVSKRRAAWAAIAFALLVSTLVASFQITVTHESPRRAMVCAVVDASGSTSNARERFVQEFHNELARRGGTDARVCVASAGSTSIAEFRPISTASEPDEQARQDAYLGEIDRRVGATLRESTKGTTPTRAAAPELLNALAREVRPGDSLYVFSDGVPSLPGGLDSIRSDEDTKAAVNALEKRDLIPDLRGVDVTFLATGSRANSYSESDKRALRAFWQEWSKHTGANVSWLEQHR